MRLLVQRSKSVARPREESSEIEEHSTLTLARMLICYIELVTGLVLVLNHPHA